jgi:hypothetical protein
MRFAVWLNQGKGDYLQQKLREAGHTVAETVDETDLFVADCDWRWALPRPGLIQMAHDLGAKVALYPHGGMPTTFVYDGLTEPDPLVELRLEHGQGSVDVADALGLDLRQQATGWLFSPTSKFKRVKNPKKILFAPQHPNMEAIAAVSNGHDPGPSLNRHVFHQLLALGLPITVSLVGPLWKNGVWFHPRASFVSNPSMSYPRAFQLVQEHDVVVAAGTMAALAVSCGKPTVALGQGDYSDYVDGAYRHPNHADVYGDELRYPLDAGDSNLDDLIRSACDGNRDAARWRARFVGDDGTDKAVKLLEQLVGVVSEPVSSSSNVIIEGVTARSIGSGG